ncbi:MAG: trigger factor [Desulfovibrionaceae bacterium]
MEYILEDISPVKKKVQITVDPKEVEAAILAAVAVYRTTLQMDGFRKGKVPASVVEKRFHEKIYQEAKQDLVNVHINEVVTQLAVSPISSIDFDGKDMVRGEAYVYSISFEVLPPFDLPGYEGLEVDEEKAEVKDAEVDEVVNRILRDRSDLVPVEGKGPAVDGQVVELDFAAFENGVALEGISAQNFQLSLGERQALDAFEDLVKTIPYGEEKEGEVTFPADFIAKDLAGKTVTMKVKVHAIKERKLPGMDDTLAKSVGYENVEKLRAGIVDSYMKSRKDLNKAAAQKTLLDRLLKMVDFVLPESMVETHTHTLVAETRARLERQGKSLESIGKTLEQLVADARPEAENITRVQVFLLTVAAKEGLEVTEQEVDQHLYQMCHRSGEDFKEVKDAYARSGMIFTLRDRLLSDKAMDAIYAKSTVTEVEPKVEITASK